MSTMPLFVCLSIVAVAYLTNAVVTREYRDYFILAAIKLLTTGISGIVCESKYGGFIKILHRGGLKLEANMCLVNAIVGMLCVIVIVVGIAGKIKGK